MKAGQRRSGLRGIKAETGPGLKARIAPVKLRASWSSNGWSYPPVGVYFGVPVAPLPPVPDQAQYLAPRFEPPPLRRALEPLKERTPSSAQSCCSANRSKADGAGVGAARVASNRRAIDCQPSPFRSAGQRAMQVRLAGERDIVLAVFAAKMLSSGIVVVDLVAGCASRVRDGRPSALVATSAGAAASHAVNGRTRKHARW